MQAWRVRREWRVRAGLSAAVACATALLTLVPAAPSSAASAAPIWLASTDGGIFAIGGAPYHGGLVGAHKPIIIGIAGKSSGRGYWTTDFAGDVFAFGDAVSHGDLHGDHLNKPVVGIAATPSGNGYWLVASDGGIFSFGDARFHGSLGALKLHRPITGIATTPSGNGYCLVATDGGIFTLGDARFFGSLGGVHTSAPIAAMTATVNGGGYWILQRDGHVAHFGNATSHGDVPGGLSVGIVRTQSGNGYWIAHSDGTVHPFGDAGSEGIPGVHLASPVVGLATPWASSSGYGVALLDMLAAIADHPPQPVLTWVGPHQVALTFDDGPGVDTQGIVNTLALYHVPATFFTVGYEVAARPDLVRNEYHAGNSVETHTWDHKDLTRLSPQGIHDELLSGLNAIIAATGHRPTCYRPPYGATNATVREVAATLGLHEILWNVDPSDYTRPGTGVIESRILSQGTGRGLVVGIHDGGGPRDETLAALPTVINGLRARGYTFVKLCA